MKPITCWYRQYKDKSGRCFYEHNHIEEGNKSRKAKMPKISEIPIYAEPGKFMGVKK